MAGYNERKLSVLSAVEDLEEARAFEVMNSLGDVSFDAVRQALSRYHYQGLLNRSRGLYWLSERGYERLEYLRSKAYEDTDNNA